MAHAALRKPVSNGALCATHTAPAANLDRADLGDAAAVGRPTGGLQIDDHEGGGEQGRRARVVEEAVQRLLVVGLPALALLARALPGGDRHGHDREATVLVRQFGPLSALRFSSW